MEDVTYLPRLCPRCGKALADDAPEGLCAACLLAAGTETLTHATLDDALTVVLVAAPLCSTPLSRPSPLANRGDRIASAVCSAAAAWARSTRPSTSRADDASR
jgi:hypothetical protein